MEVLLPAKTWDACVVGSGAGGGMAAKVLAEAGAAGSGGVYAVDVRNPAEPRDLANWSGARFSYDADALAGLVYVAGGPEGLYILRLTPDGFAPVGLSRSLGFVAAVEAGPVGVYVLDRTGAVLRRLDPLPD